MRILRMKNVLFVLSIFFFFGTCSFVHALTQDDIDRKTMKRLPHINAYQAYALFQQGKIIIFDVHPGTDKKKASILGAHYLDPDKIQRIRLKLPKEQPIGVY